MTLSARSLSPWSLASVSLVAALAVACGSSVQPRAAINDGGGSDAPADGSPAGDGPGIDGAPTDAAPADAAQGCPGVPLVPDATGFIAASSNSVGVTGAWYSYVDCNDYLYFDSGVPNPGVNCSLIQAPPNGSFQPASGTASKMCTKGTTAIVPTAADWQTHWGAGIGLDLNNPSGTKLDYDANAAGVIGFCFVLSGAQLPAPPLKVNLPSDQSITDNWYFETESTPGVKQILFTDRTLHQTNATTTPFDPSKLLSIQFQIPASMSVAVPWDFCIDQLTAIVGPVSVDGGAPEAGSPPADSGHGD